MAEPAEDGGADAPVLGDVPLFLTEPNKVVDHGPARISLGAVKLYAWQVHPVVPIPVDFPGNAAYLIKVNYEFRFAPGVPAPAWAEVGFRFCTRDVLVKDAVPRSTSERRPPVRYQLSTNLEFGPLDGNGAATASPGWPDPVALPETVPQIFCSVGGAEIGWRHERSGRYPVPRGTHSGWLLLLVPEKCRSVRVVALGDCDLGADTPRGLAAAATPDAFTVRLSNGRPAPRGTVALPAGTGGRPRVFISYAQESPQHMADVTRLCDLLRGLGIDVRYDQDGQDTRRSWTDWTNVEISRSDFVIVVASRMYRAMSEGETDPQTHRGIRSEYDRLTDALHGNRDTWIKKILPVVLPGHTVEEIPRSFSPYTHDHYVVSAFTEHGAADLLAVLRTPRG
ncbi:toll/interleukin-1 receptor domain-containing protein [Paractinoplanes toevensis]|uniref:SEFIR domain-containing protein n=1 Tax=Paractinoplanes toevensis TaxID=571911 RepID=A0A920BQ73_9ACTN|nr:toll/interleukin-1 receptor domain-containing protein [Actinoplanes toevensis]GIM97332.1 hypothetical protein Ato02nite_091250 [Actinoplanes toevensis]